MTSVLSAPFLVLFKVHLWSRESSKEIGHNKKMSLSLRHAVFWTLGNLNTCWIFAVGQGRDCK